MVNISNPVQVPPATSQDQYSLISASSKTARFAWKIFNFKRNLMLQHCRTGFKLKQPSEKDIIQADDYYYFHCVFPRAAISRTE